MSVLASCPSLLRPLWLLACVLLLLAPVSAPAAQTGDLSTLRQQALDLVNQARRQQGLQPLTLSGTLNATAQGHAEDMLRRDYYSHVSPEGEDVMDRYRARGGSQWKLVAENIASCSPCAGVPDANRIRTLHQGWMDSPRHRKNLLRPGITRFGLGIAAGAEGPLYAVQTLAGPGGPRDAGEGQSADPLAPDEAGTAFARALDRRREARSLPPLDVNPALSALAATLLPASAGDEIDMQPRGGLMAALPPGAQDDWRSLSVLAGSCGGCGARPDRADIGYFLDFWMEDRGSARRLLDRAPTALGFAMRAYGDGRKVAVVVLGRAR